MNLKKILDATYNGEQSDIDGYFEKVCGFPCWAVTYAMYGESDDLTEEDKEMVDSFMEENGYDNLAKLSFWRSYFAPYPAFGKPCFVEDWVLFHKKLQ